QAFALTPLLDVSVVVVPPHARAQAAELRAPALVDGGRSVATHLGGDLIDREPPVARAELPADDPCHVRGHPAMDPGVPDGALKAGHEYAVHQPPPVGVARAFGKQLETTLELLRVLPVQRDNGFGHERLGRVRWWWRRRGPSARLLPAALLPCSLLGLTALP